jgi:hypothetical protein
LRDLALAYKSPGIVVVERVDDAASAQGAAGIAWTGIDADIDDNRGRGSGKKGRGRCESGVAVVSPAAADEKLVPSKAIETIEAEAVKPVRTEAIEPQSSTSKTSVEPMRREMLGMAEPEAQPSAGAWPRSHMRERRRNAEERDERGKNAGARHPEAQGKPHGIISGAATSI